MNVEMCEMCRPDTYAFHRKNWIRKIWGDDLNESELKEIAATLSDMLQRHVKLSPNFCTQRSLFNEDEPIGRKLDFLERILDILRIEHKYLENELPLENFLQGTVRIDENGLQFLAPDRIRYAGSGTAPIRLQPKLLLFLLFRHNRGYYQVYDIIDSFIKTIWDSLERLDFKRTKTGVTRCFTNTRFAANTLRKYGLLKFTQEEAFKTWALSLPGILVATKVMEKADWSIPRVEREQNFDLHPDIRKAFDDLKTYDKFVKRLASVCKPNSKVSKDFKAGSKKAYELLGNYWRVLKDPSLSKNERGEKSQEILNQIEKDTEIKKFHDEFSLLVKVGDFLSFK